MPNPTPQNQLIIDAHDRTKAAVQAVTRGVGRLRNVISAENKAMLAEQRQQNAQLAAMQKTLTYQTLQIIKSGMNQEAAIKKAAQGREYAEQARFLRNQQTQAKQHQQVLNAIQAAGHAQRQQANQKAAKQEESHARFILRHQANIWRAMGMGARQGAILGMGGARGLPGNIVSGLGQPGITGRFGGGFMAGGGGGFGGGGSGLGSLAGALVGAPGGALGGLISGVGQMIPGIGGIVSAAGAGVTAVSGLAGVIANTLVASLEKAAVAGVKAFGGIIRFATEGAIELGKLGVELNATRQQLIFSLTALGKTEDQATDLYNKMSLFADLTPFDDFETIEAGKQLETFGFTTDKVAKKIENMKIQGVDAKTLLLQVGNVAYAMGRPMEQVVRMLGAAQAGIFRAQQFAPLGISRMTLQGQGIKFDDMGRIQNRHKLLEATLRIFEERFGGMMERSADKHGQLITTMISHWKRLDTFINENLFKGVDAALGNIGKVVGNVLGIPNVKDPREALNTSFSVSPKEFAPLVNMLRVPFDMAGRGIEYLSKQFEGLVKWLNKVANWEAVEDFFIDLIAIVQTLGQHLLKLIGIDLSELAKNFNLADALKALSQWIFRAASAFAGIASSAREAFLLAKESVIDFKDFLVDKFQDAAVQVQVIFTNMLANAVDALAKFEDTVGANSWLARVVFGMPATNAGDSLRQGAAGMRLGASATADRMNYLNKQEREQREREKDTEFQRLHGRPRRVESSVEAQSIADAKIALEHFRQLIHDMVAGKPQAPGTMSLGNAVDMFRRLEQRLRELTERSGVLSPHQAIAAAYQQGQAAFGAAFAQNRPGVAAAMGTNLDTLPPMHDSPFGPIVDKLPPGASLMSGPGAASAALMARYNPGMGALTYGQQAMGMTLPGSPADIANRAKSFFNNLEALSAWVKGLKSGVDAGVVHPADLIDAQRAYVDALKRNAESLMQQADSEDVTEEARQKATGEYLDALNDLTEMTRKGAENARKYLATRSAVVGGFFDLLPDAQASKQKQKFLPAILRNQRNRLVGDIFSEKDPQRQQDLLKELIGVGGEFEELFDKKKDPFKGRFRTRGSSAQDFILGSGPQADMLRNLIMNGSPGQERVLDPMNRTANATERSAALLQGIMSLMIPAGFRGDGSGVPLPGLGTVFGLPATTPVGENWQGKPQTFADMQAGRGGHLWGGSAQAGTHGFPGGMQGPPPAGYPSGIPYGGLPANQQGPLYQPANQNVGTQNNTVNVSIQSNDPDRIARELEKILQKMQWRAGGGGPRTPAGIR